MCFRHSKAANNTADSNIVDCFRAKTRDKIRTPYRKPLYWKWIWSMIRSAGDNSIDMAMAWAPRFNEFGDVEMYLFDGILSEDLRPTAPDGLLL